jgi:uridine kinase
MKDPSIINDPQLFSHALFGEMKKVNAGLNDLEWYEFDYALENLSPVCGWMEIPLPEKEEIEARVSRHEFFYNIQLKPRSGNRIVLDEEIVKLAQTLFKGLVAGVYSTEWINSLFYFDVRGFLFLVRTEYFPPSVRKHLNDQPFIQFKPKQKIFENRQDIGLREFVAANQKTDQTFIQIIQELIEKAPSPFLLTIAGPSGSGKTEIVQRLRQALVQDRKSVASIEMDNFYKDGSYRDGRVLDHNVIHFDLFRRCLQSIMQGQAVSIPRYNFITTTSSHDLNGALRPGQTPLQIEPADVIFLEGNFPFQLPEIARWVGLKIVYLTDDPVRLKRKWRRDIDYRKKYDQVYFCNRYFRTQFLRAEEVYRPLMTVCDMVVDTTGAAVWLTPELARQIKPIHSSPANPG